MQTSKEGKEEEPLSQVPLSQVPLPLTQASPSFPTLVSLVRRAAIVCPTNHPLKSSLNELLFILRPCDNNEPFKLDSPERWESSLRAIHQLTTQVLKTVTPNHPEQLLYTNEGDNSNNVSNRVDALGLLSTSMQELCNVLDSRGFTTAFILPQRDQHFLYSIAMRLSDGNTNTRILHECLHKIFFSLPKLFAFFHAIAAPNAQTTLSSVREAIMSAATHESSTKLTNQKTSHSPHPSQWNEAFSAALKIHNNLIVASEDTDASYCDVVQQMITYIFHDEIPLGPTQSNSRLKLVSPVDPDEMLAGVIPGSHCSLSGVHMVEVDNRKLFSTVVTVLFFQVSPPSLSSRIAFHASVLALRTLAHPCIQTCYGAHWPDRPGTRVHVVTERRSARLSDARISHLLDDELRHRILKDVALGLTHMHSQQMFHGALSPDEIYLHLEGNALHGRAKLNPTAIVARAVALRNYCPNSVFVPPEIILGRREGCFFVDVWSFGVIIAFLFNQNCPCFYDLNAAVGAAYSGQVLGLVEKLLSGVENTLWRKVAFDCLNVDPETRPSMPYIVELIERAGSAPTCGSLLQAPRETSSSEHAAQPHESNSHRAAVSNHSEQPAEQKPVPIESNTSNLGRNSPIPERNCKVAEVVDEDNIDKKLLTASPVPCIANEGVSDATLEGIQPSKSSPNTNNSRCFQLQPPFGSILPPREANNCGPIPSLPAKADLQKHPSAVPGTPSAPVDGSERTKDDVDRAKVKAQMNVAPQARSFVGNLKSCSGYLPSVPAPTFDQSNLYSSAVPQSNVFFATVDAPVFKSTSRNGLMVNTSTGNHYSPMRAADCYSTTSNRKLSTATYHVQLQPISSRPVASGPSPSSQGTVANSPQSAASPYGITSAPNENTSAEAHVQSKDQTSSKNPPWRQRHGPQPKTMHPTPTTPQILPSLPPTSRFQPKPLLVPEPSSKSKSVPAPFSQLLCGPTALRDVLRAPLCFRQYKTSTHIANKSKFESADPISNSAPSAVNFTCNNSDSGSNSMTKKCDDGLLSPPPGESKHLLTDFRDKASLTSNCSARGVSGLSTAAPPALPWTTAQAPKSSEGFDSLSLLKPQAPPSKLPLNHSSSFSGDCSLPDTVRDPNDSVKKIGSESPHSANGKIDAPVRSRVQDGSFQRTVPRPCCQTPLDMLPLSDSTKTQMVNALEFVSQRDCSDKPIVQENSALSTQSHVAKVCENPSLKDSGSDPRKVLVQRNPIPLTGKVANCTDASQGFERQHCLKKTGSDCDGKNEASSLERDSLPSSNPSGASPELLKHSNGVKPRASSNVHADVIIIEDEDDSNGIKPDSVDAKHQLYQGDVVDMPLLLRGSDGDTVVMASQRIVSSGVVNEEAKQWNKDGEMWVTGEGREIDFDKAVSLFRRAAEQGSADAHFNLACCFEFERGLSKDEDQAHFHYKQAALLGHVRAQVKMGSLHEKSDTNMDKEVAFYWYNKAKDHSIDALFKVGEAHERGSGVEKSIQKAVGIYEKAVNQGCANAMFSLGRLLQSGCGVSADKSRIIHLFQQSAEKGNLNALLKLGRCFRDGWQVKQDINKALECFVRASGREWACRGEAYLEAGICYELRNQGKQDLDRAENLYRQAHSLQSGEACYRLGLLSWKREEWSQASTWWKLAASFCVHKAYVKLGKCAEEGKGLRKSAAEAFKYYKKAMKHDCIEAYALAGLLFETGQMNRRNVPCDKYKFEASKHYEEGVRRGCIKSMGLLGQCYMTGFGKNQDLERSLSLFRAAESRGDTLSMTELGDCYRDGIGLKRDPTEACRYYKKAATMGYAEAQVRYADCLYQGHGTSKDVSRALYFVELAIKQSSGDGHRLKGDILLDGDGTEKDVGAALIHYRKAVQLKDPAAMVILGKLYESGNEGISQDLSRAFQLYKRAAEMKDSLAMNNLGVMYERGLFVRQCYSKAVEWYVKGVECGGSDAACNLADCYMQGNGVSKDVKKAFMLYKDAAEGGDRTAKTELGTCYSEGIGVKQNGKLGISYYKEAHEAGDSEATRRYGVALIDGTIVERDVIHGMALLDDSIARDNVDALLDKGRFYCIGRGVPKDASRAFTLFKTSSERGNSMAMKYLANMHFEGEGVSVDRKRAFNFYIRSLSSVYEECERCGGGGHHCLF